MQGGPQNFARRDQLLAIQAQAQKKWEAAKLFEADAPETGQETISESSSIDLDGGGAISQAKGPRMRSSLATSPTPT